MNYIEEADTIDIREALYFMSQNPPYKFARLKIIPTPKHVPPILSFVFHGEKIHEVQRRYMNGDYMGVDYSNLKLLASEIETYLRSQEDYCI